LQVNEYYWYHPGLPARIPGSYFARNLVKSKSLLFQLVKRDFQQRYVGSAAGWVWSVIHPLVLWASYVFIFRGTGAALDPGGYTSNIPLYLFVGMLPWFLFSETVTRASNCVVENANLITKTVFPSEILPVSIFLSSLGSNVLVTVLVAMVAAAIQGHVNPAVAMVLIYMPIVGLFAIGVAWVAAALQVYLRDTAQVVVVTMTFWFWLTPIFLPESKFPDILRWVLWWNPMAYVVRAYRLMLLGHHAPEFRDVAVAAGFAVGTFICGGLFFRHMKKGFPDVL
jgi:homopolymeric O-antigen transport system permease protein